MLTPGKIEFTGSQGHKLAAYLDYAGEGTPKSYALYAHCFTCTKDILAASRIAGALGKQGVAVLRFDFTGLGASEGNFSDTNFSSNVADLLAGADFMRTHNAAPALMIGHSLGGAAVLASAGQIPEVKGVVTMGAPSNATNVLKNFDTARGQIENDGEACVDLAGRPFLIKKQFIEDAERVELETYVKNLGKALLVCHAPLDETVAVEHAAKIFGWAKHPKSYISLDNADHLISRRKDADYIAQIILAWSSRYVA